MVLAKVPIVPQWNLTSGCICTPEGGFLYVGARSINYIGPIIDGNAPLIKAFHTRQTIYNLDIDPAWGTQPKTKDDDSENSSSGNLKYFAVLAQDNSVQIWDFDKGSAVSGHKAHFSLARYIEGNGVGSTQDVRVLMSYMCNRKVLSVDAQDLVVYCVASNTYGRKPSFLPSRNQQWTILRCSPYDEHIFAMGSNRGAVIVGNLQKSCVVYTLRGHDASITALSWISVNIEVSLARCSTSPPKQSNTTPVKALPAVAAGADDIFDIYDYEYLDNEFGAPTQSASKAFSENNAKEFVGIEKPKDAELSKNFDFNEACQSLKEDINALKESTPVPDQCDIVTLADCQQAAALQPKTQSSGGSNESTEGSMELLERQASTSDDDTAVFGVMSESKQQILHKAEVHTTQTLEVNAIACNPQTNGAKQQKHAKGKHAAVDILLASASVDGNFWIWNTVTGASCDNLKPRGSGTGGGGQQGKNTHIEIGWFGATNLFTSNKHGELSYWSLLPQDKSVDNALMRRYKFKEEKRHWAQRGVVSFSVSQAHSTLWCISSYRDISCENIKTEKLIAKYSCASTNISAMRECPDDMNKIALGFSDRRIGIIDISQMSATNIHIDNFSMRIDSPVMSLKWSPDNKRLAYGTFEGRVGILNVENTKLQPIVFNPFCGKAIYSIDWQGNYIYVVCNETLAVYDDTQKTKDAHIISGLPAVSSVSVRDKYLFLGTQRGYLQIFRLKAEALPQQPPTWNYDLLHQLHVASRYITEIAWSPIVTDQFAVVANANCIHVYNFNMAQGVLMLKRKIEIANPKATNACVKWSNRAANRLLTCGFDGAIRIWDLNREEDTEYFLKQFHCPMTCGLFLPTDEEIVLCAGKSTSLEFFDMRIEKSVDYSQAKWKRANAHTLDNVQWAMKMLMRSDTKPANAGEKRRNRRAGNSKIELMSDAATNNIENPAQLSNILGKLALEDDDPQPATANKEHSTSSRCSDQCSSIYLKNPVTLFYLTTKELNKDALDRLQHVLAAKTSKRNALCAKLFGTKAQAKELLTEEINNHQHSETKGICNLIMPQLSLNLKDEILKCIQQKKLTTWHVALAPTLSYNFWQKCCSAYAEQLLEQGYALQAASYMLALHKYSETIELLADHNYHKEAMLIARVYLQTDDPLVERVTEKWITHLEFTGNLYGATLLCALSGQKQRAYETLAKVRSPTAEVQELLNKLQTSLAENPH